MCIRDSYDMLEENHLILPTTEYESVGQGTFAFNHELPDTPTVDGRYLKRRDVWGYMDSQATLSISPKMFEEIIFLSLIHISVIHPAPRLPPNERIHSSLSNPSSRRA